MVSEPRGVAPLFDVTDRFDAGAMAALMAHPDVYWPAADALAPQPENIDFVTYLARPHTWTVAGTYRGVPVGFVSFVQRTTVLSEIHVGFLPGFRGKIAKAVVQAAIGVAFQHKGVLKLCAMIPSDNRAALFLARALGFREEGRLTRSIVRRVQAGPPLRDLVILTLFKE